VRLFPDDAHPFPAENEIDAYHASIAPRRPQDPALTRRVSRSDPVGPGYRWVVLSNTTLAMPMATLNMSSVLIAMPAIFRGIHLDPLQAGNFNYLLWMLMGYMLVTAVAVVNFGRLGDMFGRVRMYNLGFVVFTLAAVGLSMVPGHGPSAALTLIVLRMVQALGGALLMANTAALLTDAFPEEHRGLALGLNQVVALAGTFFGLLAGGLLATVDWRLVFLINVPVGIFGTVWSYWMLREQGERAGASIDWVGNLLFAGGLGSLLIGVTYGIRPYGAHAMGWTNPFVLTTIIAGLGCLVAFVLVEQRVREPMFQLHLFGIRPFAAGNIAGVLSSIGRGGLMFMLIIWLQGIWLPQHGYSFEDTPLWAGICMLPLNAGFLAAGPVSGWLSDKFGARPFATGGMLLAACTFAGLHTLPVDFGYALFALVIFLNGVAFGLFAAPNTTSIMNSVPARYRGVASGMRVTFQNTRHADLDRDLLLADDRRPHRPRSGRVAARPDGQRRSGRASERARASTAGRLPVRGLPRLQPYREPARDKPAENAHRRSSHAADEPCILSAADLWPVRARPRARPLLLDRDVPAGGLRILAAWRQVHLSRTSRAERATPRKHDATLRGMRS
jgi:MFS family permease